MKTSPATTRRSLLLAALLLSLSMPLAAQDTASSTQSATVPPGQIISPEARAVLSRMTATLQGLQTFAITADTTRDEVASYGYKVQHNEHDRLLVQRPNKLRAEVAGDLRNRTFVYDGSKLVMYSPDDAAYVSSPATDNLKKLIGGLLDAGVELPLIDVLYQAAAGTLTETVTRGVVVGDATVDGTPCDHLAFRQPNADWQLWVEKGGRSLPRKIVITTRYEVGDPQFQAVMRWDLQPKIDASSFVFTPPQGAKEIPFVDAAAIKGGSQ